ncbi:metalloregulator ArsR/SmtB family transcription factor [Nocardia sp. CNY236]|uniref:helix-turn-helix transcriptional regulator n=1 Tax=Nocardia sp. CNY236 TaxID=1169152 RepID=UPI0003FEB19F|nr:transcriptional regulator [Nocardia sp. CNY236]
MSDSWPRRRLLAILRGTSAPLDARELARITGQHVTTVRFHLDVLTRESLVRQFQQPPRGRGRPRIGYSAVQRSVGYQDLARVLADQLGADPHLRAQAAVAAGRAWGARLGIGDGRVTSLDDAKDVTMTLMSELGFAPERDTSCKTEGRAVIRLTACPLRELARTHSEVVCGVHRGLIEEVLDRRGARGGIAVQMHPFIEPELCVARLELAVVRRDAVRQPARVPTGGDGTALIANGEAVIAPSGRVVPQVRDADPDIAKQSAQQW